MKRHFSAGGIVFNHQGQVLLIRHSSKNGYWGFPKGTIDEGENSQQAALREVKEEAGVEAEIVDKVGEAKYVYTLEGEKIFKINIMYSMQYKSGDCKDHDWEIEEARWFEVPEAIKQLTFTQDKNLLKKAVESRDKSIIS